MAWGSGNHSLDSGNARHLRQAKQAINVRPQSHDGSFAIAPCCGPRRRDTRNALCDRKAVLFKDAGQIVRRLEFLKARFLKAEYGIDHLLHQLGIAIDQCCCFGFQGSWRLGVPLRPWLQLDFQANAQTEDPAQHIVQVAIGLRVCRRVIACRAITDQYRIGVEQIADV